MYVYAGIDEAGYGPLLGPMVVARSVFTVQNGAPPGEPPPCLWSLLAPAVCRQLARRRGRIAVNDSKKLTTPAAGIHHLELGCLAFAARAGCQPAALDAWLHVLAGIEPGELDHLPWYAADDAHPWEPLPSCATAGEVAVAANQLKAAMQPAGVELAPFAAAVVPEDQLNRMIQATRSKAAASFTFVARHLAAVWQQFGKYHPFVAVDRQGGRSHYRELLSLNFPDAALRVLEESPERSSYELADAGRRMTVRFEVSAETHHLPVALASMLSKYTRELMMARFNAYFRQLAPHVAPTAGYTQDGRRFLDEIRPTLASAGIDEHALCRIA